MRKKKNRQKLSLLLSMALVVSSVAVPSTTVFAAGVSETKSITLNVDSQESMYVGMSKKIKVKSVKPKNGSKKVTYKSSDPEVVKVSSGGTMKALTEGEAIITVTSAVSEDVFKEVEVNVKNLVKNKTYNKMVIPLDKKKKTRKLSRTSKVKATYLKLSSSRKKVATVSKAGVLTGKKVGTTKITIKGKKGLVKGAKQVITLYVAKKSVETVALDKTSVTLKPGDPIKLTTSVTPNNAANVVVFTSSDEDVATVDQKGNVKAVEEGTAEITATTVDGSKKAVCVVTVSKDAANKTSEATTEKGNGGATTEKENSGATTEKENSGATTEKENSGATTEKENGGATTEKENGGATTEKENSEATTEKENSGATTEKENSEATTETEETTETPQDKDACVILDKEIATLNVGDMGRLTAKVTPDTILDKTVTFTSSDPSVATVNRAGSIEGISAGTAVITARILGGTKATCTVTVVEPNPDGELFEVPYVSTYYFNPKPTIYDEIVIPVYITDYEQSEYLNNDTIKTMDLLYEVDGTEYRLENLKLGDNQVTLGKLSEGIHTFTLQSVDPVTGRKSHKLYNELWVINPETYEITKEQTYEITDNDLEQYGIKKDNSTDPTDMIRTRDGLTELFRKLRDEGYRKCILPNGIYRVDGKEARDCSVTVPSNFTVDMNGSTFKLNTITENTSGLIATIEIDAVDSHLTNGILEGDRFERKELGLETGYLGEGINTVGLGAGKYCSITNMVIKNTTGHTLGAASNTLAYKLVGNYKSCYIKDGKEIASDICQTSELADLSKMIPHEYIRVGNAFGYKGLRGESPVIFVNYYDENQEYMKTETGFQFRRMKIPDGAKYASVTFKSEAEMTYDDNVYIYCRDIGAYLEVSDVDFYDTRTTAIATGGENILIENVTYTRCGNSITPAPVDFEDPAEETQDIYYRNNINYGGGVATVIDNRGFNHVYENLTNHYIMIRGGVYGGVVRNIDDPTSRIDWGKQEHKRSGYGRLYNNKVSTINVTVPYEIENSARMKVKDCTFVGKGFASTSDGTAIYENCVVTGLEGSAGVFKNCTIFPGDYFRSDLYFYDCIFKDMTGEGREVNVRILLNKRFGFYNCKFPETTCISYGNAAYFENCDFNNVYIVTPTEQTCDGLLFYKCNMNSDKENFIHIGPYVYSENYVKIRFRDCMITHTGNNLIYLWAQPNQNSLIEFQNCKIDKTTGNISAGYRNLAESESSTSIDIRFIGCEMDKTLPATTQGNPEKVRVTYEE